MWFWRLLFGAIFTVALLQVVNAAAFCKWYGNALIDSNATVVSGLCRATTGTGAGDRYARLLMEYLYCSTPQRRNAVAAAAAAAPAPAPAPGATASATVEQREGTAGPASAGAGGGECTAAEEARNCRTVAVVGAAGNSSICLPAASSPPSLTAAQAAALPAVVSECLGGHQAEPALNCRARLLEFFRMLGCVECGAEATAAAEIYGCCTSAEGQGDCAEACAGGALGDSGTESGTPGPAAAPAEASPESMSAVPAARPLSAVAQAFLLLLPAAALLPV